MTETHFTIDIDVPTCPTPDFLFSFQPADFEDKLPKPDWPCFERLSA